MEQLTRNHAGIDEMLSIATLCSKVKFDRTDVPFDQREIIGDATETGLTRFAGKHVDFDLMREKHTEVFAIPFNSTSKYAATIVQKVHRSGELTLYLKGAPERVLARCTTILVDGRQQAVTDAVRAQYNNAYDCTTSPQ